MYWDNLLSSHTNVHSVKRNQYLIELQWTLPLRFKVRRYGIGDWMNRWLVGWLVGWLIGEGMCC